MDVIRRNNFPDLPMRLKAVMSKCQNVAEAFREVNMATNTAYSITKGDKPSVEADALKTICKALGVEFVDLGVVFPPEPQKLVSVGGTPLNQPVLGAYWDLQEQRYMFVDVTLNSLGQWINANGDIMRAPDGWLPLPTVLTEDEQ